MSVTCTHLDDLQRDAPSADRRAGCPRQEGNCAHLPTCKRCGHLGCGDNTPSRHTRRHRTRKPDRTLIHSFDVAEHWWRQIIGEVIAETVGTPSVRSHN